jgi:peptidoglycan/LPS O-acetylase OafA/YrhL
MCFWFLDSGDYLPGVYTIFLLGSTAFLILLGGLDKKYNPLNSSPLKFIGLRSYTIYLVHWPLIIFWNEYQPIQGTSTTSAFLIILLGFTISSFIYRLYERPIRQSRISNEFLLSLFSIFSIIVILMAYF